MPECAVVGRVIPVGARTLGPLPAASPLPAREPETEALSPLSPDSLGAFVFSPCLPHPAVSSSSFSSALSLFLEIQIEPLLLKGLGTTIPRTRAPQSGCELSCPRKGFTLHTYGGEGGGLGPNSTKLKTLFWAGELKADMLRLMSEAWADSNPAGRN